MGKVYTLGDSGSKEEPDLAKRSPDTAVDVDRGRTHDAGAVETPL
jgi:hypothetical protein